MTRDKGLEELVNEELSEELGITDKAMFGGWAWLLDGKLLCGARDDGMLVRLGTNPIPIKYALARLGWIEENYRLPLCPMADHLKDEVDRAMWEYGLRI
jgi:hypothetical protein